MDTEPRAHAPARGFHPPETNIILLRCYVEEDRAVLEVRRVYACCYAMQPLSLRDLREGPITEVSSHSDATPCPYRVMLTASNSPKPQISKYTKQGVHVTKLCWAASLARRTVTEPHRLA